MIFFFFFFIFLLLFITVSADPYALQTSRFYGSTLPNYSPLMQVFRVYTCKVFLGEKCVQEEGGQSFLFLLMFWLNMREKKGHELFFSMYLYSLINTLGLVWQLSKFVPNIDFLVFMCFSPSFHNLFNISPLSFLSHILILKHLLVFIPIIL